MPFTRALPRIADRHNDRAMAGVRKGLGRLIYVYLCTNTSDNLSLGGWDNINEAPFDVDTTAPERTFTYTILKIQARVRWNNAEAQVSEGTGGFIKLGDVTVYVGIRDSYWLDQTVGNVYSYMVVDGKTVKVQSGPEPTGFGAVLQNTYELEQYSLDGLYNAQDGGVPQIQG